MNVSIFFGHKTVAVILLNCIFTLLLNLNFNVYLLCSVLFFHHMISKTLVTFFNRFSVLTGDGADTIDKASLNSMTRSFKKELDRNKDGFLDLVRLLKSVFVISFISSP